VVGTDVVAPPGKKFGSFTRPVVRFGRPLDFSRYEGLENDRYILRSVTDEIMYEIMRLSGQEYVDKYAAVAKEEQKKAEAEQKRAEAEQRRAEKELAAAEAKAAAEEDAEAGSGPEAESGAEPDSEPRAS
jgi:1-acyl-sn-glycerol-3-phosphate acyltransferase